jgi:RNA polymerase sigma factor (sigma-70 family)
MIARTTKATQVPTNSCLPALWKRYAASRDNYLLRNKLAEAYLDDLDKLHAGICSRLPPGIDYDELWSAGAEELLTRVELYDPHRGVPFWAFARPRIRGAMLDCLKARNSRTLRLSDEQIDAIASVQHDGGERLEHICRDMTPNETTVVYLLFQSGRNVHDVAAILNKTPHWIRKVRESAYTRLRNLSATERKEL